MPQVRDILKHFRLQPILHSKALSFKHGALLVATVVFGSIGAVLVVSSRAATPPLTFEAENGTLSGYISKSTTPDASAGKAVVFGAAPSGTLLFEDDFTGTTGTTFDKTKWHEYSSCAYNPSAAYGFIKCGEDETLDGQGHLLIPATPTRGQGLMTGENFRFQYGTVSAWIKLPPQPGYWPAFWTLNNNTSGANASPVGEVDVMEGYTTWNYVYHATGHNWTGDSTTTTSAGDHRCAENSPIDLSANFNKYSAKIEPGKITYYFNDVQCGALFTKDQHPDKPWAFGPDIARTNWLILTLAVGGAGGQQTPATENAQMLVDRVEVRSN